MWLVLAAVSAFSAGLVTICIKIGMKNIDSDIGTFLRTAVVLIFTFLMVLIVGALKQIRTISGREWLYISASGVCTGLSWICYFRALKVGDVSKVVPIDKLSTVLTMILAIIFLGEPFGYLTALAMLLLLAGTFLMIKRTKTGGKRSAPEDLSADANTLSVDNSDNIKSAAAFLKANVWLPLAVLSLVFASLTSILAKIGMKDIDSNLGTFLRTSIVLAMSAAIVLARGKINQVRSLNKKNWLFLSVSGLLTGISWLAYFAALQKGNVSIVVPIDKLSILITILFSRTILKEKQTPTALIGLLLLTAGTLLLIFI